jgi:beta-galactosidase
MKQTNKICHKNFLVIASCFLLLVASAQQTRKIISFDNDWKFIREDAKGAAQTDFNDAAWRILNVPHDWSIEGPYDRNNPTGRGGGYLPAGIGWYRKTFTVNEADAKQLIFIEFDGVMANSDVWINGFYLGKRPNGYASFEYELTGHLNFGGKKNVIAVRADNTIQPASRYYTGAYEHYQPGACGALGKLCNCNQRYCCKGNNNCANKNYESICHSTKCIAANKYNFA